MRQASSVTFRYGDTSLLLVSGKQCKCAGLLIACVRVICRASTVLAISRLVLPLTPACLWRITAIS